MVTPWTSYENDGPGAGSSSSSVRIISSTLTNNFGVAWDGGCRKTIGFLPLPAIGDDLVGVVLIVSQGVVHPLEEVILQDASM